MYAHVYLFRRRRYLRSFICAQQNIYSTDLSKIYKRLNLKLVPIIYFSSKSYLHWHVSKTQQL